MLRRAEGGEAEEGDAQWIVDSLLQVAQHLAATYGDKAFEVAKLAKVTGKRWPIVGKRLVSEFPYIEAEVCRIEMFKVHCKKIITNN